jgi:gamma-glutamyltranspeptidase
VLLFMRQLGLAESMRLPRIHHQFTPDRVICEVDLPERQKAALSQAGFELEFTRALGIGCAIKWVSETDDLTACLDPRFVALI